MGIFGKSTHHQKPERPLGNPEAGIARGVRPGDLGAWVIWNPATHAHVEVFRVVVKPYDPYAKEAPPQVTYTFGPAHAKSFVQYLEMPYEVREFLRGVNRARHGQVSFDFLLSDNQVLSKTYDLETITDYFIGKGPEAPELAARTAHVLEKDKPEVARLTHAELKGYSEKIRQQLEEKRLKEEAERKAKEEAAVAAAAKAAAAKAAAEAAAAKAAAAKSAGAGAAPAGDPNAPTLAPAKCGMFFGTSTGHTQEIADMIKAELGDSITHMKNVTEIKPIDFTVCECLILGVPTWHIGEMQDDWAVILPELDKLSFKDKKVAIFGLGDGVGYPDTYVDAMQELWVKFEKTGAKLFGLWPTEGYPFQKSKAIKDGKFLGVVIDVENQHEMSEGRIKTWCAQISKEMGL